MNNDLKIIRINLNIFYIPIKNTFPYVLNIFLMGDSDEYDYKYITVILTSIFNRFGWIYDGSLEQTFPFLSKNF